MREPLSISVELECQFLPGPAFTCFRQRLTSGACNGLWWAASRYFLQKGTLQLSHPLSGVTKTPHLRQENAGDKPKLVVDFGGEILTLSFRTELEQKTTYVAVREAMAGEKKALLAKMGRKLCMRAFAHFAFSVCRAILRVLQLPRIHSDSSPPEKATQKTT